MGLEKTTRVFLQGLIKQDLPRTVIDADGLKLLAGIPDWYSILTQQAVITPHPGEMSVLTGLTREEIQSNRIEVAEKYARLWGKVLVLKGAYTVIAEPGGSIAIVPVATPALARAGTGDVLAGLIAGLLAQGMAPFQAACAGAYIHAKAGLEAEKEQGNSASVLAGDLLGVLPKILSKYNKQ
jgi:NAD(P)H-hydrate epimerase